MTETFAVEPSKKIVKAAPVAFSVAALLCGVTNAAAAPALALNNVNLRQGPGLNYTIILTIPGGSNIDITGCSGGWCQATFQGQYGYVIATSVDQGNGPPAAAAAAPPPPSPGYAGPPPGYVAPPPPGDDAPVYVRPGGPPPPPPPGYYGYGPYYGPYWRGYYGGW